jgi:hypothetical protein
MRVKRQVLLAATLASTAAAGVIAWPAAGEFEARTRLGRGGFHHLSQSVAVRQAAANPAAAPDGLRETGERMRQVQDAARAGRVGGRDGSSTRDVFNADNLGLPQNEESVNACRSNTRVVLEGTNDYRGFVDPQGNFTGWHFSLDGGRSLYKEGLLPPLRVGPKDQPSGGDPVVAIDEGSCDLYMVDLNFDPADPAGGESNGIGVYKSSAARLASCGGGPDPSCWPQRRAAAASAPPHFLDKPWGDVGLSGPAGRVLWVTYSDFLTTGPGPVDFTASIKAVRCDAQLVSCTPPIDISGGDRDVQFSDVTIGPDGSTYVTWSEIQGELEETPQTFIHKLRVAPPGSLVFGPTRVIAAEPLAIPFGGVLHANDFRVATIQKNEVAMVNGRPRIFDVWDACSERPLDSICVEPVIKLTYSDDQGVTWSAPQIVSSGGDNYFPTISSDTAGSLALAWFTNRYDPQFHNRQDVELARVDARRVRVEGRQRLTSPSNESEADPLLGGLFIGDYIEVFAHEGRAWTGYNANYRQVPLLGSGTPLPQQDNYLTVASLGGGGGGDH